MISLKTGVYIPCSNQYFGRQIPSLVLAFVFLGSPMITARTEARGVAPPFCDSFAPPFLSELFLLRIRFRRLGMWSWAQGCGLSDAANNTCSRYPRTTWLSIVLDSVHLKETTSTFLWVSLDTVVSLCHLLVLSVALMSLSCSCCGTNHR